MSGNPLLEASADVRETLAGFVPAAIRRRFALKLGVLFLVVVVVIAGVGGIIYLQTGSSLKQDTKQQLSASSQLQAETVSGWDSRMEEQTKFMVHAEEVKSGETASVQSFVDGQLDSMPDQIVAIHYVNTRSGEVLASSHDDATGTTLVGGDGPVAKSTLEAAGHSSDHEHSGEDEHAGESSDHGDEGDHTEHAVVHTRPYQSQQAGGPVMAYLTTIGDQNRAIVVVTDLAARAGTMQRPLGSETWVHVVNDEGVVVLSHQTGKIGAQNMGSSGVDSMAVEMGLQGNNGYMEMQMGGRAVSMGFAPVPGTDWVVMTHVESSDAFALQQDVLGSIVALVALAFVGLAAIGLTVGRSTAQSLEHLSTRAKELEDGDLGVELETSRSDEIGRLYTSFDSMRDSLRDQIDEAEAARTEAEAARQEAETLNDHLESKAEAYQRVMEDCAEGDLTRRMDPTSQSEAMRAIADTFNGMMDQLEAITHQVKGFADAVASSSEEVTASSEEIQSSADQVANSVQEISDGADRQSETLQSVAEEMNTLSTTIEEMAASANQVAETAEETATTGEHARESAAAAIEEMSDVERESEAAVTAIEDLQSRMAEIEEITEFITDVAEQTNVLALNANIEAARAGEAGEGFAVVAEEVKDLAEETRDAAEEIEELVVGLREQTETTADEVRSTSDEVARSAEAVEETVDALREIAEFAEETNTGVQEISAATQQQASSTNEVVSMVDDAAAIASQTADEASTVAGASEEQTAALSEMTDNAGSLAAEADQLRQSLDRFGTDPDPRQTTDEDDLTVEAEDD